MKFFLVEEDNPACKSLCEKLSEQAKNGAVIALTDEEFELSKHMTEIVVPDHGLIQVNPGESYLAIVDFDKVDAGGLLSAAEYLQISIAIVSKEP